MSQPVFLDTPCFIYLVEQNSQYLAKVKRLFDDISIGKISAITSIITLSEVLVRPIKNNDKQIVNAYIELFDQLPNLILLSPQYQTAIEAAKIRAMVGVQLSDAYQLAIAKEASCMSFITNDKNLKKFRGLKIFLLEDLAS